MSEEYISPSGLQKAKSTKYDPNITDWSMPYRDPDRTRREPAQETLIASYYHQQYRLGDLEIKQTDEPDPNTNINGFIITAWNPFGKPTSESENLRLNEELREKLTKKELSFEPIVTLASNWRWLEDSFLVTNIELEQAEKLATDFGQLAFVQLNGNEALIRLTRNANFMNLDKKLLVITNITSKELTTFKCPARYPAENNSKCTMVGGPYGSAAIHAAAIWSTTRAIFLKRLGCTPCNKGREHIGGPGGEAILVREPHMPSRFGGFQWPVR
jgi:hypothetical protein